MSVTLHDFVLFLHIAAAIPLLGTTLASPAILRRVRASETRADLLTWVDYFQRSTRGNPPSALLLLGTGIYLGSSGWWYAGWFWVSVFAWIVSSALAGAVIKPSAARLVRAASAEPHGPIGPELDGLRHARGWALAEKVMTGSDIAMLWIMVAKPELFAAIAILAGTAALSIAAGLVFAKRGAGHAAVAPSA